VESLLSLQLGDLPQRNGQQTGDTPRKGKAAA
jgi:putative (di)nucleoside polyphosphate hydrolase